MGVQHRRSRRKYESQQEQVRDNDLQLTSGQMGNSIMDATRLWIAVFRISRCRELDLAACASQASLLRHRTNLLGRANVSAALAARLATFSTWHIILETPNIMFSSEGGTDIRRFNIGLRAKFLLQCAADAFGQPGWQAGSQPGWQAASQVGRRAGRQPGKQTARQAGSQVSSQAGRQPGGQPGGGSAAEVVALLARTTHAQGAPERDIFSSGLVLPLAAVALGRLHSISLNRSSSSFFIWWPKKRLIYITYQANAPNETHDACRW